MQLDIQFKMKKRFYPIVILFLSCYSINAQVTIGSTETPRLGALLDLKENAQNTSTKGLGLPRVKLVSLTATGDDLKTTIENASGSTDWKLSEHVGMILYNVSTTTPKECALIEEGPYVWDGSKWQQLNLYGSTGVKYYRDTRTQTLGDQLYPYRNFSNAGDWMLENMRYIDNTFTYADPDNYDPSQKNYVYPNGNQATTLGTAPATWNSKQGLLYSFPAMLNGVDNQESESGNNPDEPKVQGICPPGWHLPTDYEWSQLEEELALYPHKYSTVTTPTPWRTRQPDSDQESGMDDYSTDDNRPTSDITGHATAMLSICSLVEGVPTEGASFSTRQGGLNILFTGFSLMGTFPEVDKYGESSIFYTASYYEKPSDVWIRAFFAGGTGVSRTKNEPSFLASVRCKKDN